ncbi:hypothetical protein AVEN_121133-1 [Araneus ventricosus]|uniref:Uncharacterized protein n=1 Tax=Araneus ventricosus TaxID=182803 RepID=A0A4Y2E1X7_ARAVE|nr:hypothetical protein AVEN_121133-1 [Araneus ventricosus]
MKAKQQVTCYAEPLDLDITSVRSSGYRARTVTDVTLRDSDAPSPLSRFSNCPLFSPAEKGSGREILSVHLGPPEIKICFDTFRNFLLSVT